MSIQQNTDRILTTHVGSLPRPKALLDLMKARAAGGLYERASGDPYDQEVRTAVADCVRKQAEFGIDILTDGEQSKPGFFTYVRERLTGFEERPDLPTGAKFEAEVSAFP
ncbi:MAG TPA: hypothetical protein VGL82_17030, partial [Bryobacteraceae bacterium]